MHPFRLSLLLLVWLPLLVWLGLIFFLSSRSTLPEPTVPTAAGTVVQPYVSRLFHFAEYAVLAVLAYRASRILQAHFRSRIAVLVFGLGVALLDEAFQTTVPGRVGDMADVLTDGAGILAALLFIEGLRRLQKRAQESRW